MELTQRSQDLIKRYLLGELSASEQTVLEDEYFLDQVKYDQLCMAEDELIDDYARGALSAVDRERFERCYLANPRRRRHVKFAKALTSVMDEELAARPAVQQTMERGQIKHPGADLSWWSRIAGLFRLPPSAAHAESRRLALSLALITAALFIGLGGAWFAIETSQLRARLSESRQEDEMQQQRAQTQAQQIAALEAEARRLTEERDRLQAQIRAAKGGSSSPSRSTPASIFFALSFNVSRDIGQQPPELIIPRGVEEVSLQLNLAEHEFPVYEMALLTANGRKVFGRRGLRPRVTRAGDSIRVSVPASKFANGDNVISLSGVSDSGEVETLGKVIIKVVKQ